MWLMKGTWKLENHKVSKKDVDIYSKYLFPETHVWACVHSHRCSRLLHATLLHKPESALLSAGGCIPDQTSKD